MLEGQHIFEDIMGEYRNHKADGWTHTADIANNFKGVDFYKGTEIGNQIFAKKSSVYENNDLNRCECLAKL